MTRRNGGRPRRTYVAEFGSALAAGRDVSEYMVRVVCTKCSPEYRGATFRLSSEAALHPADDPAATADRIRLAAAQEAARHRDTFHGS